MISSRMLWRNAVKYTTLAVAISSLAGISPDVSAQSVELTPEQRRMLNQLPASQREQAQRALQDLRRRESSDSQQSGVSEPLSGLPEPESGAGVMGADAAGDWRVSAEGGSRLVIRFEPRIDLEPQETEILESDPVLSRLTGVKHFALDENGILELPGLAPIPLHGLDAEACALRLSAESALAPFDITVSILGTQITGPESLEPFGYSVFQPSGSGFEPVASGPVPDDYILGPGDAIRVQFFGNVNRIEELQVSRDGDVNLPELGPMTVAGQRLASFRDDLSQIVRDKLIGTKVSVSMGQLRTIRVFVMGDVNRPGSYVVSSLATISSALYYSEGVSEIGSLRNIQLKRKGEIVATLDLYDFLLRGDTSDDYRLQPGDVIFVPPIGATVGVAGAVRRPAIYEIEAGATINSAVRLAGGMLPDAFAGAARLERVSDGRGRTVISLDLESAGGSSLDLRAGDTLTIPKVLKEFFGSIELVGHVQRPGRYEWQPGMRLVDLIPSASHLKGGADANYVLLRREDETNRQVEAISANLAEAWNLPGSDENVQLQDRDKVFVFDRAFGRQRTIATFMEELRLQAERGNPQKVVSIVGEVRAPGVYPLEPDMRVSDLIRAGGNLAESAYTLQAELTRYDVIGDEYRAAEVRDVDLQAILKQDADADFVLSEHDYLRIDSVPNWDTEWTVTLEGEVLYPGDYRIRRGESLRDVLSRAGGLTAEAFPEGAVFLREELRDREQEQIDALIGRLETDLASLSLQSVETSGAETLSTGQVLLEQLRNTKAVGRLVIDLESIMSRNQNEGNGIDLRDGDRLLVPKRSQVVTVIGEVQQSTSHLYVPDLGRDAYIEMSGGTTRRADEKLIYVVRANGAVITGNRSRWFGRAQTNEIRPGDTIVVPLETDRVRPLTFWGNVTQILYQGAIAISAIRSFDN